MKIFAKRKKTRSVGDGAKTSATPERAFKSDPVVEQLLKKDPSEWNAKEKRMVKRYQDRKVSKGNNNNAKEESGTTDTTTEKEEKGAMEDKDDKVEGASEPEEQEEDSSDSNTSKEKSNNAAESESDDDDDDDDDDDEKEASPGQQGLDLESVLDPSILESLNSKQRRKLSRLLAKDGTTAVGQVVQEAREMVGDAKASKQEQEQQKEGDNKQPAGNQKDGTATTNGTDRAALEELLNTLNSKQRRKLTRRLERDGDSCLDQVKAEAEKLLNEPAEAAAAAAKADADATASSKKRKRRRGPVDVSGLTPEERLRREEQRKMQTEASEKRAKGDDDSSAKFKHPLNSERRRANRRKPKWAPKRTMSSNNPDKVEHNASGFQVRQFKKAEA